MIIPTCFFYFLTVLTATRASFNARVVLLNASLAWNASSYRDQLVSSRLLLSFTNDLLQVFCVEQNMGYLFSLDGF